MDTTDTPKVRISRKTGKSVMTPEEAYHHRMYNYRHNGLKGCAVMMQRNCCNIINSDSVTDESRELASQIEDLAIKLEESLTKKVPFWAPSWGKRNPI